MYTFCRWYQRPPVACIYFLGVTCKSAFRVAFAQFMQTNFPSFSFCVCNMFSLHLQVFNSFSTYALCGFQLTEPKGIFRNLSDKEK